MAVYLTGDTHGTFDRIADFCKARALTEADTVIILGDAGFNYFLDERDSYGKHQVARLPVTVFCVHGNHEERPENIPGYEEKRWRGGKVLFEPDYPNILFGQDGEFYDFDGKKAVVIGGAYSIDKYYRLMRGIRWFPSEQPDEQVMARVEAALEQSKWRVNYVLTHTVPYDYMPRYAFIPGLDETGIDKSTERWLQAIESRLQYDRWYAGHYHVNWSRDRVTLLFEEYLELGE